MENYIDLHMHSYYSDDGSFSVEELLTKCEKKNIRIIAITDHNTVLAIPEAIALGKEMGIICIPGVEIDCTWRGIDFHVLAYGIDYKAEVFKKIEENVNDQELVASKKRIALTNQLGFHLTIQDFEEFTLSDIWPGETFAEVLLSKPEYLDHEVLKPYRAGGSRSDNPLVNFYWDYYSQGKPCYSEIKFPTLEAVIDIIHEQGGVAVLAHPGVNLKGQFQLFEELIDFGLDGVEAFSSYHSEEEANYFYELACKHDLLVTCGSDYHGKTKPAIHLGDIKKAISSEVIEKQLRQYGLII